MRGIGEMNHKIILQKRTVSTVGGKSVETWSNIYPASYEAPDGSCPAARQDMSNRQFHQASAEQSELTAIFTVRTPIAFKLDSGLRILEDGQEYYAVGKPIDSKPRRGFTEIRTTQLAMEGYGRV